MTKNVRPAEEIVALIARYWPRAEWLTGIRTFLGESDLDANSLYVNPKTGDKSYGIAQVNMEGALMAERLKEFGLSKPEDLFDPPTNIRCAFIVYQQQGWGAWGAYRAQTWNLYGRDDIARKGLADYLASLDTSSAQTQGPTVTRPAYQDTPNRSGGLVVPPLGVVVHRTYGGYDGAVSWLKEPGAQASAHFVVAQDGRAVQLVPLPDPDKVGPRDGRYKAWHVLGENPYYVGIEHEGTDDQPPSDAMLATSAAITRLVCDLYSIPKKFGPSSLTSREHFRGIGAHRNMQGNDHTDGYPWPWDKYLALVNQEDEEMTDADFQKVKDIAIRAAAAIWYGPNAVYSEKDFGSPPLKNELDAMRDKIDAIAAKLGA